MGQSGRIDEAQTMLAEAKVRNPEVSIDMVRNMVGLLVLKSGADWIIDGLRKAGLQE